MPGGNDDQSNYTGGAPWKGGVNPGVSNAPAVKDNGLIPGTDIPSTGNPITDAALIQQIQLEQAVPQFDPYRNAGLVGLEQYTEGSTAEGLDDVLARIMSGESFGQLKDERTRAVQGQLAAGGLTRSGKAINEAANVPSNIALMLDQILSGRQGNLAEGGFMASSQIADLTTRVGEAIASGILGNEASENARDAAKDTNRSNLFGAALGGLGTAAAGYFSDPRLKENVKVITTIGPLDFVEWDWIPETEGTIVRDCPTQGFLSTQVREHYPQHIGTFGGYDVINYSGLIESLETSCH